MLLSRLEKHAVDEGLFADMQFGFKEGVECTDASFTILETITCQNVKVKFLGVSLM